MSPKETIGIVGYGEIGRALEKVLLCAHRAVAVWDRDPEKVHGTKSLDEVASRADVLFLCVPSPAMREVCVAVRPHLAVRPALIPVSLAKGVEEGTRMFMDELLADVLPRGHRFALLGGPMLAEELLRGAPGVAVIASKDADARSAVAGLFKGTAVLCETTPDAASVAIGGVLKNVYALGLGIAAGLAWGGNAVGWFLTHAEEELITVGEALGGKPDVLRGMAGFGDLIATGFSPFSKNREVGEEFVRTAVLSGGSEGARSLPFIVSRLGRKPLPPVLTALRDVCIAKKNVQLTFERLLSQ